MAEDVNKTQVVTESDVKDGQVVTDQGVTEQVADAQNQDGALTDGTDPNKPIPYSRLKEATDATKAAEEARKVAEEQAAHAQRQIEIIEQQRLMQANPVQQPKSSMEQALADCNVTAEEMYGEVIPRVMARKDEIDRATQQQQQAAMGVQQFVINHPDISQVVGSVNPATGQIISPNAEVLALVAKKPYLASATLEAIFDAVKDARKLSDFEKAQTVNKEHLDRQGIDTETQPLGGSAAGGVASGDVQQPMMSREAQQEIRRKVEAGETVN